MRYMGTQSASFARNCPGTRRCAKAVIDFLERAFDAALVERIEDDKGHIRHAQVR